MNYAKPEVTVNGTATLGIRGQQPGSKIGTVSDGQGLNRHVTAAAYEADE